MKFKNPIWKDANKDKILVLEINESTLRESKLTFIADKSNAYFTALLKSFSIKDIDDNTNLNNENKRVALAAIKKTADQNALEEAERKAVNDKIILTKAKHSETEKLFEVKLNVFELDIIKQSKNRKLKAVIRKASSVFQILVPAISIYTEENKLEQLKELEDIFTVGLN